MDSSFEDESDSEVSANTDHSSDDEDVLEVTELKAVRVICRNCLQEVTLLEFCEHHDRLHWILNMIHLKFNVQLIYHNTEISCICGKKIGQKLTDFDLLISKSSVFINY